MDFGNIVLLEILILCILISSCVLGIISLMLSIRSINIYNDLIKYNEDNNKKNKLILEENNKL